MTGATMKLPESEFARGLSWAGVAIDEKDYTIWGAAPIAASDGRIHLFAGRWPEPNVDPAWRKSSEIAHYVADSAEGSFTFQSVVVTGSGTADAWDRYSAHNPEIKKFGDTYVLLYISNSDYHQPPHPFNQSIGMLVSDTLYGPWKKAADDGLILTASSDPSHWTYGKQVVNPAIIQVGDLYHLYFKSLYGDGTAYGVATSSVLTGPYKMTEHPLTGDGITLEDACVFRWDGKVCLLTTDNHGDVTGIPGGGTLWISDDGMEFPQEKAQIGYGLLTTYYPEYVEGSAVRVYGNQPKLERPKVLLMEDRTAYLYGPSGWAIHGGRRTACYVLKTALPQCL